MNNKCIHLKREITIRYQNINSYDCGAKSIQMVAEYILGNLTEEESSQILKGGMTTDKIKKEINKFGLITKELSGKDFDFKLREIKEALSPDYS